MGNERRGLASRAGVFAVVLLLLVLAVAVARVTNARYSNYRTIADTRSLSTKVTANSHQPAELYARQK